MGRMQALSALLFIAGLNLNLSSFAAIPKNNNLATVKSFLSEGSFRGGEFGSGVALLGIKRVYSSSGDAERIILEMGDRDGKIYSGKPGYFHAQLFRNPSELSLDLTQVLKSRVTNAHLKNLIKQSKLIQTADLSADREDHSTHFNMRFKAPIKMRVFTLSPKKSTPKLVIDITKI